MSTVHGIAPDEVVRRHADRRRARGCPARAGAAGGLPRCPRPGRRRPGVEPLGEGHSNVTYALRRDGADLVLRRPPRPPLPPSAHDVLREARVLRAMTGRARVPEVLAACDDESVIGAPFYLHRSGAAVIEFASRAETRLASR